MEVEPGLLEGLCSQETRRQVATNGLVLNLSGSQCAAQATARAPKLAPLCGDMRGEKRRAAGAEGFTLEARLQFSDLAPGQIIVDSRDAGGRGYVLTTTDQEPLRIEICDGWQSAFWNCDRGLLGTNAWHHVVVGVDGFAKVIWYVIDGALCDGGTERQFGFGRFNPTFKDVGGGRTLQVAPRLHGELKRLHIYDRALLTSEAVSNFHASKD
jgi:hypothetical protein